MKITRRNLAVSLAAAATARAQRDAAPDDDLKAARERMKNNSGVLARKELPEAAEPAFQFKA
jgi:hypothetical protein